MSDKILFSDDQLAQIAGIVAIAMATAKPPKATRKAKAAPSPEETAKIAAREENRANYLQRKKDTAVKLLREKGVHYNLFQKGRKILIFSDLTVDKARRNGTLRGMGERLWSTVEGHSLKEAAKA